MALYFLVSSYCTVYTSNKCGLLFVCMLVFVRMAQWEKFRLLSAQYTQQLHELYDREGLPMDVRHYLSAWIEKQDW